MHATSSRVPTSRVKRARSPDGEDGPRRRPRHGLTMINNQGNSGNSRIVNILGDQITHNNDSLGPETHALLESVEQRLKVVHDAVLDGKVEGWLSAPDVSQNLNAALRKRQAGTGHWFLHGAPFAEWKENSNIVLCIYGEFRSLYNYLPLTGFVSAGCGKTILCSTIIEAVKDLCKTPLSGWAYFFFDSRNANKGLQLYENLLRSILSQLCSRCGGMPEAVTAMYQAHGSGKEQPSIKALEDTLRQVIGGFDDVYIMVDSLDECEDRGELLKWIEVVAGWASARWHVLTTSRLEPDITSHLKWIRNIHIVHLKGKALDKDISIFLHRRLSRISRWSEPIRALVMTTLIKGADGMFRWVAMQIDSLQHCLKVKEIKAKLKVLPKDLEETYERILASSARQDDLLQMLHWLAFSARALRVEELAEVLSVDFEAEAGPCHDPDLRYANPHSALAVCYGLVTVTDGTVKLAHFSVKEYLLSDRIKTGTAAQFSINERLSELVIAQTCIAYLLIFNKPDSIQTPVEITGPFPLHLYAAENTARHLRSAGNTLCAALQKLLLDLFIPTAHSESALVNWRRIHDPDETWQEVHPSQSAGKVVTPLYYASLLGLQYVVERLLLCGTDVNIQGGRYGTALRAAAKTNCTEIVKLLLEHGADPNIHGKRNGTALHAAADNGRTETVKLLLEHGADPNIHEGIHGTMLQAAVYTSHADIVKLLLEHGANANIQGGPYGTALHAAADNGRTEIVKLLLEHGTDPNIHGESNGTALHAAAYTGHTDIAKLLLEHGTNPNIQGGLYVTALQAAVCTSHAEIVKLLLEHGANANIHGGPHGFALQAAAYEGHTKIFKLLLEHGADPNIQEGLYEPALQVAADKGRTEIVKLLLEHGADPNIQGWWWGSAAPH